MNVFYFPPKNSICYENGHKNTVYRKKHKVKYRKNAK